MEAGVQEGWGMGYKAGGHQCTSLQCPFLPFQGHEGQRSLETVGHNGSFCVFTKEYRMVSTTCFSRALHLSITSLLHSGSSTLCHLCTHKTYSHINTRISLVRVDQYLPQRTLCGFPYYLDISIHIFMSMYQMYVCITHQKH